MHYRVTCSRLATLLVVVSIFLQHERSSAAKILGLFPLSSRSHSNIYSTITKALAQRGHHFTIVTSVPLDSPPPNYKQIDVSKQVAHHLNTFNVTSKLGLLDMFMGLKSMTEDVCRDVLANPEVKKLINPSKMEDDFDLILASNFFSECFYAFSHIYKTPIVLISPSGPMPTTDRTVGNVILPSFIPNAVLGYSNRMTFPQRVINTLTTVGFSLYYNLYILRNMDIVMKDAFGETVPSIHELKKNISLILLNNHFSLNSPYPLVPNLVEVGGLHIKPPKELPKDLKSFMDESGKNGVIYFSLGSILKSSQFPIETRNAFIDAFSQVKQKVLWKWEGESPIPGQSKNVRLEKWLPQQDVLAHPNLKLFITHGGLLSFQEATSRGVPLIGIPYYGDQDLNMQRVTELHVGVKLDPKNLTKENILNAINHILGDSTYSTNMKKIKSIVADQIDDPLQRAVYWIEYVLRHDGAIHLKAASIDLEWYQLYMLDILFVVVVMPLLVLLGLGYVIVRLQQKRCKSKKKSKDPLKMQ